MKTYNNKIAYIQLACSCMWAISFLMNIVSGKYVNASLNFVCFIIWLALGMKSLKEYKSEMLMNKEKEEKLKKQQAINTAKKQKFDFFKINNKEQEINK